MRGKKQIAVPVAWLIVIMALAAASAQPHALRAQNPYPRAQPARGPDTPDDAPAHAAAAPGVAAVGDTTITFAAPKVTLRVADGFDLDQYLFRPSSPIDFRIDLQGFQPHPTDPTRLTLRVYDVDQQGAPPTCAPEVDQVLVNGTYLGNLTGANNQWSIVTFSIPAGVLTTGVNTFQVLIDTLATDCWAVEVDWAEVELPFNIAQVEASALDDVTIRRGTTDDVIGNAIWQTSFDAGGTVVTPANPDDPIADSIKGARAFRYGYKLDVWPSGATPTWQPDVEYTWEVVGGGVRSGTTAPLSGWQNEFSVTLPDTIGKYTLNVTLNIFRDSVLLRTERRSHTLYVLLDAPKGPISDTGGGGPAIDSQQPRTAWLDISTSWASGLKTITETLDALNTREYGNALGWGYGYPKQGPTTLIERGAGQNGDCYTFRDVWRVLAGTLGISTLYTSYDPPELLFVTSTRPALDGNASASARNSASGTRDRWVFSNHQYGRYSGTFYDPTYGLTGTNSTAGKESNVFCKGDLARCAVLSPPPARAVLTNTGTSVNGWTIFAYETFATALSLLNDPAQRAPGDVQALASAATLTGSATDQGVDSDSNGLFDLLRVDLGLHVTQAGTFNIVAALTDDAGDSITLGSLAADPNRNVPVTAIDLGAGAQTVSVYLSGRDIRAFGADGPYILDVALIDDAGSALDHASFDTAAYDHRAFQGPLAELRSLSDAGLNTDGIPGYDLLRISATLDMLANGAITLQGQLFAGEEYLGDVAQSANLSAGSHTLNLDFAGPAILAAGRDGPYTLYLSIADANGSADSEYTTAAYPAGAFEPPDAYFSGGASDSGQDSDGDGRYELLNVAAAAVGLVPGSYTLHGILQDRAGTFIDATTITATLGSAPTPLTLGFSGPTISRRGVDGPYTALLALTDAAGATLMSLEHTTAAYSANSFEAPGAVLSGSFGDSGIDSDSDGFFDLLRVGVGVSVAVPGTYQIAGSLHDADGTFIVAAQASAPLSAGPQTVSLDFDGSAIRAHGADGPYRLIALTLAPNGGQPIDHLLDAYTTGAYSADSFEPVGLALSGDFAERTEDSNNNGLYDTLVIDIGTIIAESATYAFNARLVDANGEEIIWAAGSQYLAVGSHTIALRFDGRSIYGNGADGPYHLRDLSIYSGSSALTVRDVYTTAAYTWGAFEPAGVVRGQVLSDGRPVPNAHVFIAGVDSDLANSDGAYRLTVPSGGNQTIVIDADPALAPWRIIVNGSQVAEGTQAPISVAVGQELEVNFVRGSVFPATAVLDSFARANGPLGPNWSGDVGGYQIIGQQVDVVGGLTLYWQPSQFGSSQEVFVTLVQVDPRGQEQDLLLKVQGGGRPDWRLGAIEVLYDAAQHHVRVETYRPGQPAWTVYQDQRIAVTLADGDQLGARALDNGEVWIYRNTDPLGRVVLSADDQAFFNSKGGAIGLWLIGAGAAALDDFGGGTSAP